MIQKKNTRYKARRRIILTGVMIMFTLILSINLAFAFEFDNVKSYNAEKKTATIRNGFGLGSKVAEIKLDSPQVVKTFPGYQKVAEMTYNVSVKNYKNVIKRIDLYDNKRGLSSITRNVDIKYKTIVQKEYPRYVTSCDDIDTGKLITVNGSKVPEIIEECETIVDGTITQDREEWVNLPDNFDLQKGEITIGFFTEVLPGDDVEWIMESMGARHNQWAIWTSELNTGLVTYWNFDTTTTDSLGNINLTLHNNVNVSDPGILGQALACDGTTDYASNGDFHNEPTLNIDRAFSVWIYPYGNDDGGIMGQGSITVARRNYYLAANSGGAGRGVARSVTYADDKDIDNINVGWNHYVLSKDSSNVITSYHNGINVANHSLAGALQTENNSIWFCTVGWSVGSFDWSGQIDEAGIWNRTLSASEVEQLYNGGTGITYTNVFSGLTIDQSAPEDGVNITDTTPDISCNYTKLSNTRIANVSLFVYDSSNNLDYTNTEQVDNLTSYNKTWTTSALTDDSYNWACAGEGNDTLFEITGNRTFSLDSTFPAITLTSPTGEIPSHVLGSELNLNWTIVETNPSNCFYTYNATNISVNCGDNGTTFNTIADQQTIIFYANDTVGNLNFSTTSWTYGFLESAPLFNLSVTETSTQGFGLELQSNSTILSISAFINYSGEVYDSTASCTSGNCSITNDLDISLLPDGVFLEEKQFFWNFTIFNGTGSTNSVSETKGQNVSRIVLEICNATWNVEAFNFTSIDESNLSRISPFNFDGSFEFWEGGGTITRSNNFSISSGEVNLCLSPHTTLKTDATINYDEGGNASIYGSRIYTLDNQQFSNVSQSIELPLLLAESSTSFILKVQDQSLLPVSSAVIEIYRYYPGEGQFRLVQSVITDDNGQTVGFFEVETVDYKFVIKKNGETLLQTGVQKVIPETSPFTLTFNIGDAFGTPWQGQLNLSGLTNVLTYNKSNSVVTFTYTDTDSNFTQGRLYVTQPSASNSSADTIVCNETSSLASATLTCNLNNVTGYYVAGGYITRTGESLVNQLNVYIEDFGSVVGLLGLFFGWFLILIASFIFKFNDIAGIWAVTFTAFFVNLIGLIHFGTVFITALLGIAILLTWLLER